MRDRLLRLREVMAIAGLSRSSVYRLMAKGTFPSSVTVSPGAVRWRETEVMAWMRSLPTSIGGSASYGTSGEANQQPLPGRSRTSSIEDLRRLSTAPRKNRKRLPAVRDGRRTAGIRVPHADPDPTP